MADLTPRMNSQLSISIAHASISFHSVQNIDQQDITMRHGDFASITDSRDGIMQKAHRPTQHFTDDGAEQHIIGFRRTSAPGLQKHGPFRQNRRMTMTFGALRLGSQLHAPLPNAPQRLTCPTLTCNNSRQTMMIFVTPSTGHIALS